LEQRDAPLELAEGVRQDIPSRHSHCLTRSFMVTCKSATPSRITENTQIFDFELSEAQMDRLDALECGFKVTPSTLPDPESRRRYYEDMP
jgi:hypothetical protein